MSEEDADRHEVSEYLEGLIEEIQRGRVNGIAVAVSHEIHGDLFFYHEVEASERSLGVVLTKLARLYALKGLSDPRENAPDSNRSESDH